MPLRATSGEANLHAFDYDEDQWAALKSSYRALSLAMPCCGRGAIPKTSTLGNHFFAHSRRGPCTSAPESAQHLYCKQLIAEAAKAAGWTVTTERPGACPQGEEWIADVFCEQGNAKIAFEVQMSPQTHEETLRRQRRYRESGVRGAWFHAPRKSDYTVHSDKETPSFVLRAVEVGKPPAVKGFPANLPEFVTALLSKRVTWEAPEFSRTLYVEFMEDACWACQKPVKQVCGMTSGDDTHWWYRPTSVASLSQTLGGVQLAVLPGELRSCGLNEVGMQQVIQGKRTNWPHCNLCIHCSSPQNNYHVSEKLREAFQRLDRGDPSPSPLGVASFERVERGAPRWVYRDPPTSAGDAPASVGGIAETVATP
ncbi:competence protein CoiA [Variovorax sp. GT1P44]|uniref:competence protein CoiA n=1 Tax=Variovorax sp. GT1P44 TaxID=3443742 RepID=UPI003F470A35